jgi:SAM-dependent methyltransferase
MRIFVFFTITLFSFSTVLSQRWNKILTADNPTFNTEPNEFLIRMIGDKTPGSALDVGMGQGRNSIWLARQGWAVTGFDPADKAVELAEHLANQAGVEITTQIVGAEDFDWGTERWDLIVFSYSTTRPWIKAAFKALKPGGYVVVEAFHKDATASGPIGRSVVWDTNQLLTKFSKFRILHYEDTLAIADFGLDRTQIVRLFATKR